MPRPNDSLLTCGRTSPPEATLRSDMTPLSDTFLHGDGETALFVFQTKGIQHFLLGSDRLRDMVGATEIVDQLPTKTLGAVLSELALREPEHYQRISQAAGSARLLFKRVSDARRLARVWPMVCAYAAPDLEMVQTVQTITNADFFAAANEAERQLASKRNAPVAPLPEVMPPVLRTRRTGLAAVERDQDDENQEIDRAMQAKRKARRGRNEKKAVPAIYTRFGLGRDGAEADVDLVPREMADIAGRNNAWLALVHVDGNGLGQMFLRLQRNLGSISGPLDAPEFYRQLSDGLIEAGDKAARKAVSGIRDPLDAIVKEGGHWPLLPVVLAGDDLALILRAELAVPFTKMFLQEFETQTQELFETLCNKQGDPECKKQLEHALGKCLTAGAGIAFIKPRYSYNAAYHLCESLAGFAKRIARKDTHLRADKVPPSTLTFHIASGASVRERFDDLLQSELRSQTTNVQFSFAPYVVGQNAAARDGRLPTLDELENLARSLGRLPRGQVRHLLHLLREAVLEVSKHLDRLLSSGADENAREARKQFKAALQTLTGGDLLDHSDPRRTPLLDAMTLAGFMAGFPSAKPGSEEDPPVVPSASA